MYSLSGELLASARLGRVLRPPCKKQKSLTNKRGAIPDDVWTAGNCLKLLLPPCGRVLAVAGFKTRQAWECPPGPGPHDMPA